MFRRGVAVLDRGLNVVVSVVVVALLLGMVALSFTQVLLRNLVGGGITWADVVLRHLVLAVGMFGAVLAARQGRQISIDVISRVVSPGTKALLAWIVGLFTILVSVLMSRAALVFLASEKSFSSELASGLPAWPFELVIPLGFALIALQVLLNLLLGRKPVEPGGLDSPLDAAAEDTAGESPPEEKGESGERTNMDSGDAARDDPRGKDAPGEEAE